VLLCLATWRWLPETLPRDARLAPAPRQLLRDYVWIALNPRFQRLAAAGAFNFAALFLYIASAPAFVLDLLRLDERSFGWFFIPMIGGMMLGAFVSGRSAGRIGGARLVSIGFACSGVAVLGNVAYSALVAQPGVPWAVLPMVLNAFGIALVFPIVTLAILDMYPRQRGSASSLQAFTGLVLNALLAGVLSPLVSHDPMLLALLAAGFVSAGWGFWIWEARRSGRRPPPSPPQAAEQLEPIGQL